MAHSVVCFFLQKDSKETVLNLASEVRQIGNSLFKEKMFDKARKKYSKALRYCSIVRKLVHGFS